MPCCRRRAQCELSWRNALDDLHGSATEWADPERWPRCDRLSRWFRYGVEQAQAERQQLRALAVGEEAEVANAHEAGWQQVQQEAAQELVNRKVHDALAVVVSRVPPAEAHVAIFQCDQPGVGDGDAMGVGAEIAQYMFRSAEGWLGIDDPVVAVQATQPGREDARVGECSKLTMEVERAFTESTLECGDELTAKDAPEYLPRQDVGRTAGDPARVSGSQTAGGDDAVNVGMKLQTLVPGMENAEEADLGPEVTRIARDLEESLGAGAKQQAVDQPLVLQRQRSQLMRQGEDNMDVGCRQQLAFAGLEPAYASRCLAAGTLRQEL